MPTVYLADRDRCFRKALAHALRQRGAEVVTFSSGIELYGRAMMHDPDLIVMDVDLKEINGFEVFGRLLHRRPEQLPPIVFVTQYHNQGIAERLLERGVLDYLLKDRPAEEILDAILRHLPEPSTAPIAATPRSRRVRAAAIKTGALEAASSAGAISNRDLPVSAPTPHVDPVVEAAAAATPHLDPVVEAAAAATPHVSPIIETAAAATPHLDPVVEAAAAATAEPGLRPVAVVPSVAQPRPLPAVRAAPWAVWVWRASMVGMMALARILFEVAAGVVEWTLGSVAAAVVSLSRSVRDALTAAVLSSRNGIREILTAAAAAIRRINRSIVAVASTVSRTGVAVETEVRRTAVAVATEVSRTAVAATKVSRTAVAAGARLAPEVRAFFAAATTRMATEGWKMLLALETLVLAAIRYGAGFLSGLAGRTHETAAAAVTGLIRRGREVGLRSAGWCREVGMAVSVAATAFATRARAGLAGAATEARRWEVVLRERVTPWQGALVRHPARLAGAAGTLVIGVLVFALVPDRVGGPQVTGMADQSHGQGATRSQADRPEPESGEQIWGLLTELTGHAAGRAAIPGSERDFQWVPAVDPWMAFGEGSANHASGPWDSRGEPAVASRARSPSFGLSPDSQRPTVVRASRSGVAAPTVSRRSDGVRRARTAGPKAGQPPSKGLPFGPLGQRNEPVWSNSFRLASTAPVRQVVIDQDRNGVPDIAAADAD